MRSGFIYLTFRNHFSVFNVSGLNTRMKFSFARLSGVWNQWASCGSASCVKTPMTSQPLSSSSFRHLYPTSLNPKNRMRGLFSIETYRFFYYIFWPGLDDLVYPAYIFADEPYADNRHADEEE